MTLLDVELRRAFARRLVRVAALGALAGILIAGVVVFFKTSDEPPRVVPITIPEEELQACIGGEFGPPQDDPNFQVIPEGQRREICTELLGGGEGFVEEDRRYHLSSLRSTFEGLVVPLVILAWLLAASLVGAEWRAGTTTTMLTWESRRVRVMVAKAIAAMIVSVLFFVVVQALIGLVLLPSAILHGTTAGFDLADTARFLLRGTLLAAVGAMIGFALGSIGRNTTLAMAAGFVYLAILEGGLIGGFFPGIRRWLIVGNAIVLMTGGSVVITGRGQVGAGVLLTIYGVGAVLVATALFRARDVT